MPYSKETSVISEGRESLKVKKIYTHPQKSMKIQVNTVYGKEVIAL